MANNQVPDRHQGDRAAGARQNADEKLQPRHGGPVSSLPKTPSQEADCLSHSLVHRASARFEHDMYSSRFASIPVDGKAAAADQYLPVIGR